APSSFMLFRSMEHCNIITLLHHRSRDLLRLLIKSDIILTLAILFIASSNCLAQQAPFELPPTEALRKLKSATINTSKGSLSFELFPDEAPWHVANFKYLADKGFYRGKNFHIMVEHFIIQAGANSDKKFTY